MGHSKGNGDHYFPFADVSRSAEGTVYLLNRCTLNTAVKKITELNDHRSKWPESMSISDLAL